MSAETPETGMRRRSVYLPREVADLLDKKVTDLHFATRQPKHAVLAAALSVAFAHQDEIEARLAEKTIEEKAE